MCMNVCSKEEEEEAFYIRVEYLSVRASSVRPSAKYYPLLLPAHHHSRRIRVPTKRCYVGVLTNLSVLCPHARTSWVWWWAAELSSYLATEGRRQQKAKREKKYPMR